MGSIEWMPIDSAPKDGTNVLLWQPTHDKIRSLGLGHKGSDPEGGPYTGLWDGYGWKYTCAGSEFERDSYFGDDDRPTHWAELNPPSA